jgi:hypothetical protein
LLPEKPDAVEHLLGARARRLELALQPFVLPLEMRDAARQVEVHRTDAAVRSFHFLETRFGRERATPERRELVRQVVDERSQILDGALINWSVV